MMNLQLEVRSEDARVDGLGYTINPKLGISANHATFYAKLGR